MATKRKAQRKGPGDLFSEIVSRSVEIISDLSSATAAASLNASMTSARRLVKFQKASMKAGLDIVSRVQDFTEKSLREAVKDKEWLPDEGKDVVDEWSKMMGGGIDEFSRVMDKSFDLLLKFMERAEKNAKSKADKPAAKKSAASSKPASKKAKTKATAKRKPATKKKE